MVLQVVIVHALHVMQIHTMYNVHVCSTMSRLVHVHVGTGVCLSMVGECVILGWEILMLEIMGGANVPIHSNSAKFFTSENFNVILS